VGAVDFVIDWLETDANSVPMLIFGRIVYGSFVGLVLGAILGAATIFTQRLSGKPVIAI
jgi:general stress protein CsbA